MVVHQHHHHLGTGLLHPKLQHLWVGLVPRHRAYPFELPFRPRLLHAPVIALREPNLCGVWVRGAMGSCETKAYVDSKVRSAATSVFTSGYGSVIQDRPVCGGNHSCQSLTDAPGPSSSATW